MYAKGPLAHVCLLACAITSVVPLIDGGFGSVPTLLFCGSPKAVVTGTSVGYGDYHPTTDKGKILVSIYAFFSLQIVGQVTDIFGEWLKTNFCKEAAGKKDE